MVKFFPALCVVSQLLCSLHIEHLQSKQLEYEKTIRDLEVKLASASANLQAQQKLKDKLKHLKQQNRNLLMILNPTK